jgi:dolichol-phosphate mannosyltransferase
VTANQAGRRWLKFNAVGAIGVAAQLAALGIFHGLLRLDYLTATALAVEAAALHNFVWHERWTWRDRTDTSGSVLTRLLRFNLSAGLVSILTNLVWMRWLVGTHHAQYLIANLAGIAAGSVANYFVSDLFVFRGSARVRLD